jgi:stage II sporulation protein D
MNLKRLRQRTAAALLASILVAASPLTADQAHAAIPKLETIRVGLFLESGKLKSTLTAVTLSSNQGLTLSLRTPIGDLPWPSAVQGTIQAAVDAQLHWNAGTFATWAEAEAHRSALAQAGIQGSLAVTVKPEGGLAVSVWIGSAANETELAAVKAEALKLMPSLQLTAVETASAYALILGDALLLSPTAKVLVQAQEGEVTVKERSNRTYRGAIEVSQHNGKLAVINELPFEQYLYSVVSNEMGKGWPLEALKAQAVAARTYALNSGTKYEIAHVSDTTLDQAYDGEEDSDSTQAVDATAGEVLLQNGKLITAFFSSNAGGMTSNGADVWGSVPSYLKIAPSPDEIAARNKAIWRRAALPNGQVAYIHSSYLKATGQSNPVGLPIYQITEDGVNARKAPYVDNTNNPPVAKLNAGDKVVAFAERQESNAYSWIRGPYTHSELLTTMNNVLTSKVTGPLASLHVTKRGDSGRVTEITANGQVVKASSPDAYRSVFGGLPSTRFEIERSGGYTIQGANGAASSSSSTVMYAVSASGQKAAVSSEYFVLSGDNKVSYGTKEAQYTFTGTGFGHGLGMSQWGARGWAELGNDYRTILSHYYEGVTLAKE